MTSVLIMPRTTLQSHKCTEVSQKIVNILTLYSPTLVLIMPHTTLQSHKCTEVPQIIILIIIHDNCLDNVLSRFTILQMHRGTPVSCVYSINNTLQSTKCLDNFTLPNTTLKTDKCTKMSNISQRLLD